MSIKTSSDIVNTTQELFEQVDLGKKDKSEVKVLVQIINANLNTRKQEPNHRDKTNSKVGLDFFVDEKGKQA